MRLCPQPHTMYQFLLKGASNLLQKFNLPSSRVLLSLPHLLHSTEIKDAHRLVKINTNSGAHGNLWDLHTLAFVPGVIARAAPDKNPGLFVLSEAAGPVAVPPPCSFVCEANDDPAWKLHLPVGSEAQGAFLAQNL